MVEFQLPKLTTRLRFPSSAPKATGSRWEPVAFGVVKGEPVVHHTMRVRMACVVGGGLPTDDKHRHVAFRQIPVQFLIRLPLGACCFWCSKGEPVVHRTMRVRMACVVEGGLPTDDKHCHIAFRQIPVPFLIGAPVGSLLLLV